LETLGTLRTLLGTVGNVPGNLGNVGYVLGTLGNLHRERLGTFPGTWEPAPGTSGNWLETQENIEERRLKIWNGTGRRKKIEDRRKKTEIRRSKTEN